jgi:hypothetical protein
MTIQTQYLPEHYVGDGTTADLAFTWRILAKTDIIVLARDADDVVTTLTLDSDFTILDADVNTSSGGTVTLVVPATWDTQDIFIIRDTARTQLVNIEEGSPFPSATVVKVFDRLTMMIQELKYLYRQSLHFSLASTFKDIDVPDPENGTFLGWLDNLLINANIGDMGDEEDVTQDAETFQVTFGSPLANADYQIVSLTANWTTTATWSNKLTTGFLVTFSSPAPASARLVWRVISG